MRNPHRHGPCPIILILFLWSFSLAQNPQEIRELELGKPIERELAGGEVHAYSIQLTAGQFLGVIVDQRGIDVVVALYAPDGKQLIEVDSPNGIKGPEPVLVCGKEFGRSSDQCAFVGKDSGNRTLRGKSRCCANSYAAREVGLRSQRTAYGIGSSQNGRSIRTTLLAQKKELISVELVRALNEHGRRIQQNDTARALEIHHLAFRLAEQLGFKGGVAASLLNIGNVSRLQGRLTSGVGVPPQKSQGV